MDPSTLLRGFIKYLLRRVWIHRDIYACDISWSPECTPISIYFSRSPLGNQSLPLPETILSVRWICTPPFVVDVPMKHLHLYRDFPAYHLWANWRLKEKPESSPVDNMIHPIHIPFIWHKTIDNINLTIVSHIDPSKFLSNHIRRTYKNHTVFPPRRATFFWGASQKCKWPWRQCRGNASQSFVESPAVIPHRTPTQTLGITLESILDITYLNKILSDKILGKLE